MENTDSITKQSKLFKAIIKTVSNQLSDEHSHDEKRQIVASYISAVYLSRLALIEQYDADLAAEDIKFIFVTDDRADQLRTRLLSEQHVDREFEGDAPIAIITFENRDLVLTIERENSLSNFTADIILREHISGDECQVDWSDFKILRNTILDFDFLPA